MASAESTLSVSDPKARILNIERAISQLRDRQKKLVDLMLDGTISKDDYSIKSSELAQKILAKEKEIQQVEDMSANQKKLREKLNQIKQKILETDTILTFDPEVFNTMIDRIIVGGYDEEGNKNPQLVTYVFELDKSDVELKNSEKYI